MQEKNQDIPMSVEFPKDLIIKKFGKYFTNSISWMIALAILEGFKTIYIYGVDMAQDDEFAFQRPSCEYFIGWAKGAGINVVIPAKSDLLKAAWLYPYEDDSAFKLKCDTRRQELQQRIHQAANTEQQSRDTRMQLIGANENMRYVEKAFCNTITEFIK